MRNEHWEVAPGITCIRLNHGCYALVNTAELSKLVGRTWYADRHRNTWYARAKARRADGSWSHVKMHRVLLNAKDGDEVDHDDGNGLNNSAIFGELNIAIVTTRENSQNKHTIRTSDKPGVIWIMSRHKWRSGIWIHGKNIHLGYFVIESDAASAYKQACDLFASGIADPVSLREKLRES